MQRSPEVAAATQKFYEALSTGDADTVTNLLSSADGTLLIGSDPDEWITDHAVIVDLFTAQVGAGVKVRSGDIQAYEEGSVGWIADRSTFVLPDGSEVPVRVTAVFHKEDGQWRMIQSHASIGVSNEEAIGTAL